MATTLTDPKPYEAMPDEMVDAFKLAFVETMETICGEPPTAEYGEPKPSSEMGIVGTITYSGDRSLTMTLCFGRTTAETLAEMFMGMEIDFDGSEMGDFVGEMANIVAGDVVAKLEALEIHVQMSLPTVMRANEVQLISLGEQHSRNINFGSEQGEYWVRVTSSTNANTSDRIICPQCQQ